MTSLARRIYEEERPCLDCDGVLRCICDDEALCNECRQFHRPSEECAQDNRTEEGCSMKIADVLERAVETGDFNLIYDARPREILSRPVEVCVVGRRCVYVNDRRVAGGKPYVSENLSSHTLKTTVGEVLDCFGDDVIAAALQERKASRELIASYHERRKAREQGL